MKFEEMVWCECGAPVEDMKVAVLKSNGGSMVNGLPMDNLITIAGTVSFSIQSPRAYRRTTCTTRT